MIAASGVSHHGRLGFKAGGVGFPVGPHHAVDAELSIIWEAAEVPSIRPVLHCLTCSFKPQSVDSRLQQGGKGKGRGGAKRRQHRLQRAAGGKVDWGVMVCLAAQALVSVLTLHDYKHYG